MVQGVPGEAREHTCTLWLLNIGNHEVVRTVKGHRSRVLELSGAATSRTCSPTHELQQTVYCFYRCIHKVVKQQDRLGHSETPRGRNELCHNTCARNSLARRSWRGGRTLLHTVVAIVRDQVVASDLHKEEQQDVHSAQNKTNCASGKFGARRKRLTQGCSTPAIEKDPRVCCLLSRESLQRNETSNSWSALQRTVVPSQVVACRTTLSLSGNRAVR